MSSSAAPPTNVWRVRYPSGNIAPATNQEQAERVARNVGGEALPPDEGDTDGR